MSLVCTRMSPVCHSYVVLPWTIEDDIYDKLSEIYKGTEKVVLVKFVEAIPFGGSDLF